MMCVYVCDVCMRVCVCVCVCVMCVMYGVCVMYVRVFGDLCETRRGGVEGGQIK